MISCKAATSSNCPHLSLALFSLNWSPPKLLTQGFMPPEPRACSIREHHLMHMRWDPYENLLQCLSRRTASCAMGVTGRAPSSKPYSCYGRLVTSMPLLSSAPLFTVKYMKAQNTPLVTSMPAGGGGPPLMGLMAGMTLTRVMPSMPMK
eukprot:GHRQ01030039.1.p1 GENE.GHRQ01030039.1~~GHRQ01030039.1.p1  ORF type:complete len:149 (-),score=5.02 GHRQ01030039.1:135-581(-)